MQLVHSTCALPPDCYVKVELISGQMDSKIVASAGVMLRC